MSGEGGKSYSIQYESALIVHIEGRNERGERGKREEERGKKGERERGNDWMCINVLTSNKGDDGI